MPLPSRIVFEATICLVSHVVIRMSVLIRIVPCFIYFSIE